MARASRRKILVTDLDNTLWDWFGAWHASFSAMLDRLVDVSGVPADVLEKEIRLVHQAHGTSEYSWLLNELPSLRAASPDVDPLVAYDAAVHVLNSRRRKTTYLYPTVTETLEELRDREVMIVAYTESVAYWTEWRIKYTGLDGLIDVLYSAPDHDLPNGRTVESLRQRQAEDYGLKHTEHRHVDRGVVKPDEKVLRQILDDCDRTVEDAVYVGDSMMKDIAMAQAAGVLDAHARYGEVQQRPEYGLLRRVSHWPDVSVEREESLLTSDEVQPTVTLDTEFAQILPLFEGDRA